MQRRFCPENLSNVEIQSIGIQYLALHGETPNFFHSHHPIAMRLKNYDENTTVDAKWHFLAEMYGKLSSHRGELAEAITDLFSIFNQPICLLRDFDNISVDETKAILHQVVIAHFRGFEMAEFCSGKKCFLKS